MATPRQQILDEALKATTGRGDQYGGPESSFALIARFWNVYLEGRPLDRGAPVQAHDVALMLGLLKTARLCTNPRHRDSYVDMAGYAACGAEAAGVEEDTVKFTMVVPPSRSFDVNKIRPSAAPTETAIEGE